MIGCDNHKSKEDGFTLVEMLVALTIFAILSAATFGSFQSALSAKDRVEMATSAHEKISLMRATMAEDLGQVTLRYNRDSLGAYESSLLRGGFDDNILEFTRLGRANPGGTFARSDIQRIIYLYEDGKFIRRSLAHENPSQSTQTRDRILIDGLSNVAVSFTRNELEASEIDIAAGLNPSGAILRNAATGRADLDEESDGETPDSSDQADTPIDIPVLELDYFTLEFEFENGRSLSQVFELEARL